MLKLNSNIVLEIETVTAEIIDKCIEENTFSNPVFIANEQNRRSNRDIEETITTYRHKEGYLILPRGYMRDLLGAFQVADITPSIIDERASAQCSYPDRLKGIELRNYQERAVDAAGMFDQGVIVSPTGSGKSFIGLEIIRQKGQKALIIVHRAELARQWATVIEERLGITAGFIAGDEWNLGDEITIAMVQTLASREDETKGLSNSFGTIIADEGHHIPSSTFFSVIGLLNAKYRYGLSATPNRRDGLEQVIYRAVGPAIATIEKQEVENVGATVPATVIPIETGHNPGLVNSWHEYLESISHNLGRNKIILDLATKADGAALVLVDRVTHAEQLSAMLEKVGISHVLAHGGVDRDGLMDKIKSSRLTIGTTGILGEGVDVSIWGTLIMGAPISSEIKLMQAVGRVVRPFPGKEQAIVYDLRDDCGFSGSSFKKRFEIYKKNNIWVDFKGSQRMAGQ